MKTNLNFTDFLKRNSPINTALEETYEKEHTVSSTKGCTIRKTQIKQEWIKSKSMKKQLTGRLADSTKLVLSWPTSGPEFCVVWLRKRPASGWGSLWESSSFVPWFSTFVFRIVPGTVPECVHICGFKRNSSNLDRAPKMRDSVMLNSWDSFLATPPSISSETCAIFRSLILGRDVFRDWPFLGCSSSVSLVTSANFRLFLKVAIFLKEKCYELMKTELLLFVIQLEITTKNVIL